MTLTRKTLKVGSLVNKINAMLKDSTCSPDVRNGMICVLEDALHETGNYEGFRYLDRNDLAEGVKPGVNFDEKGMLLDYPMRFDNTDDTRRYYFQ